MARSEFEFDESHVIINIDDSFSSTIAKSNYLKENIATPLICKIKSTYKCDEDKTDYEPKVLSIGPYHYGKLATKAMQIIKYECLDYVLKMNHDKKLDDYIKAIKDMENLISCCYADEIEMDRNDFLKMLLLDGCFLILMIEQVKEISSPKLDMPIKDLQFKLYENENTREIVIDMEASEGDIVNEDNPHHVRMLDCGLFLSDILLLENQIPFFLVTKIYEIAKNENNKTSFLVESFAKYIEGIIECYPKSLAALGPPKEPYHLLHLCHMYFKPSKTASHGYNSLDHETFRWQRATYYSKAGINFKKKEFCSDNPHSLLDIGFCNGTMEIPCLTIDDNMRCLFRNLIAFEQTCSQVENYVTAYAVFWSRFVNMPEDAALLAKKGILIHQLNSDAEVSDIFRKLTEGVVADFSGDCYLNSTNYLMEAHYQTNKSKRTAWLSNAASKFSRAFSIFPSNPLNHM